ncbi:MAG: hypothetical protein ACOYMJ_05065 [Candidatus Methylopumilus universalis]
MTKAKKVEFGITITKPWSKEMYAHNDLVADIVRNEVEARWIAALMEFQKEFDDNDEMLECEFTNALDELKRIQTAITCYGFGFGYDVSQVAERVMQELDEAALYRLKDIAEELGLHLEKGFVGFS